MSKPPSDNERHWFLRMVKNHLEGKPPEKKAETPVEKREVKPPADDRAAMLKNVRKQLLENHGLPPDTPPGEVVAGLRSAQNQRTLENNRLELFRRLRTRLLQNLRLPESAAPSQVEAFLKLRGLMDKLNARSVELEKEKKRRD